MKLDYTHLVPEDFAPESRVWIYQSSRLFSLSEALDIEKELETFAGAWTSHGADVKAFCTLFFGQFVVLIADETHASVSGCSTDSSVRFMKGLGEKYKVDFFNRSNLAFFVKEKVQVLPLGQLQYAADNGFIAPETPYFNNLVQTKSELLRNWIVPVKDTWLASRIKFPASANS